MHIFYLCIWAINKVKRMKKFQCNICGFIYDESMGDPEHGIKGGTCWEYLPENWTCPECGVDKADFEMMDLSNE